MPLDLPPTARVWVFAAPQTLNEQLREELHHDVKAFVQDWSSHGRAVSAACEIVDDRFLIVAAHIEDQLNAGVSGCGIDAMTRAVEVAASHAGFSWLDGLSVLYRDDTGNIQTCSRATFRALAREGDVTTATPVFDLTIADLGTLREHGLERPAGATWHAQSFPLPEPA